MILSVENQPAKPILENVLVWGKDSESKPTGGTATLLLSPKQAVLLSLAVKQGLLTLEPTKGQPSDDSIVR